MKNVVLVKSLYRNTDEYLSKEVTISGWIRTLRASNAFGFIEVNDGSFFKNIQVVFDNKLENFKDISKLPISSSIKVVGTLAVSYTHLTLPTKNSPCRSRWSPYH